MQIYVAQQHSTFKIMYSQQAFTKKMINVEIGLDRMSSINAMRTAVPIDLYCYTDFD